MQLMGLIDATASVLSGGYVTFTQAQPNAPNYDMIIEQGGVNVTLTVYPEEFVDFPYTVGDSKSGATAPPIMLERFL